MPNKRSCTKCNKKHFPPTGKKCRRVQQDVSSDSDSDFYPRQLVEHGKSTNIHVIPQSGVPVSLKKKTRALDHSGVPESSPRNIHVIPQGDKVVGGANQKDFHAMPHGGDPGPVTQRFAQVGVE